MGRLFGTDGVRGLANRDVTAELALDLAVAAAHVLGDTGAFQGHRALAVVGRDGRASGEFLEASVVAGLASAGIGAGTVVKRKLIRAVSSAAWFWATAARACRAAASASV